MGISLALFGCERQQHQPPPPSAPLPQVSGSLIADGISAPVRIVRDRWGVPHIYAEKDDDLFFAQGFVQAQDRLFQMDLWRRSVQGRLAEVLGANFIDRDVMTRRVQYDGATDADWAAYGADTRAIATAFVRGINAWVAVARARLPEEFVLAGWLPDFWRPEDLLNRTDAFVASANASSEVLRARLAAAVGVRRADELLPSASGPTVVPRGLDPAAVSSVVGDALRRVGTPPFFMGLAAPVSTPSGSNAWAVSPRRSTTGAALLANDPHRALDHPSHRYLVHLHAPGWNVIGATSPWRPGVALGHNDRIAWGLTAFDADVQDLYVERAGGADHERIQGALVVKGRAQAVAFERERTRHGVVVAIDRDRNLLFSLRWTGTEPGTASELGALALDRAQSWPEFRAALARWRMPAATVVYADVDGNIGYQAAALVPIRRGWTGTIPAPGSAGAFEWRGWRTLDELPHALNPPAGSVADANSNVARTNRLREALAADQEFGVDDFKRLQHDTRAWNAERLVPLLALLRDSRPDVEDARQRLLAWDKRLSADSTTAALYVRWERALLRTLVRSRLDSSLAEDYMRAGADAGPVVEALTRPSRTWFDGNPRAARDALMIAAVATSVREGQQAPWGAEHTATFRHPLGVTDRARRRFNIGPFPMAGYGGTLMAVSGAAGGVEGGASFREIIDLGDWDRSVATTAPGQSGSPGSPHFADVANMWAAGEYFPLVFSDRAVEASAETTLVLTPRAAAVSAASVSRPLWPAATHRR